MKYRYITLDTGEILQLGKQLGRGAFTRCLQALKENFVILETVDNLKDICVICKGLHIPALKWEGEGSKATYYSSPKYDKLSKKDVKAWSDYLQLKKWFKNLKGIHSNFLIHIDIENTLNDVNISETLKQDFKIMMQWAVNHGDKVFLDFCKPNLAVKDGHLILLDLFADMSMFYKRI